MTAPTSSAPPTLPGTSGLSDSTGESVSIVTESLVDAVGGSVGAVAAPIGTVLAVVCCILVVYFGRKMSLQLHSARGQVDPREQFDPSATDVLGEWP